MNKLTKTQHITRFLLTAVLILVVGALNKPAFAYTPDALWESTASGSTFKASYISQNGALVNIRKQAGKALAKYNIGQGSTTDGIYIYMAFEKRRDHVGKGKTRIRIAKVRIADWSLVKLSAPLKIGHANSLVYNRRLNVLLASGAKVNDPNIRMISPDTLKKTRTVKVNTKSLGRQVKAFNALAYDEVTDTYMVRVRGKKWQNSIIVLDNSFRAIRRFKINQTSDEVQTLVITGDKVLLIQAMKQTKSKNKIAMFSNKGKRLKTFKVSSGHLGKGELEAVFFLNGTWYGTVHKKFPKTKARKKYKTTYLFTI